MANQPSEAQATGSHRYQMLDVWRGLICLLVVLEHVGVSLWPEAGDGEGFEGWCRRVLVAGLTWNIGTPLFFVISGYCIAAGLDSARRKGHSAGAFLLRRLWRIYPTYWVALLGFVAMVAGLDAIGRADLHKNALSLELETPGRLTMAQWLGNLSLTETWRPHLGGEESLVFTRVAWSLCYQEQFYVVCVLLLWLCPRRLFPALAAASSVIVAFRVVAWDTGFLHQLEGLFLVRWHEFAVGLLAYWRLTYGPAAEPWRRRGVECLMAAMALAGHSHGSASTTAASVFGLVLVALHGCDAAAGRMAWLEPLRACGRRSYSIYLTHLPVSILGNSLLFEAGITPYWARALVSAPLVVLASLAVGWVFYQVVESRFLGAPSLPRLARLPRRTTPPTAPATAALLPNPA